MLAANFDAALINPSAQSNDNLGGAVAAEGDLLVAGTRLRDSTAINGGGATIFEHDNSNGWSSIAELVPNDVSDSDFAGSSVAIADRVVAIGAVGDDDFGTNSGAVYIFEEDSTGQWVQAAKVTSPTPQTISGFGSSVAMAAGTLVVGSNFEDTVVGANSGAAYVFTESETGSWEFQSRLVPDDHAYGDAFAYSVDISGERIFISSNGDDDNGEGTGSAYIFERTETSWDQVGKIVPDEAGAFDRVGSALAAFGDTLILGSTNDADYGTQSGSAYVYKLGTDGEWKLATQLFAPDAGEFQQFGSAVALAGNTALVGSKFNSTNGSNSGAAYLYRETTPGNWVLDEQFYQPSPAAQDYFGTAVALTDNNAYVAATGTDMPVSGAGGVYAYSVTTQEPLATIDGLSETPFEGDDLLLEAVASQADLTLEWQIYKNGELLLSSFDQTVELSEISSGSYEVYLVSATGSSGATVDAIEFETANVDPHIIGLSTDVSEIQEGGTVTVSGTVVDAGSGDHTLEIAWDDGEVDVLTIPAEDPVFEVSHVYPNDTGALNNGDPFFITVKVTDDAGGEFVTTATNEPASSGFEAVALVAGPGNDAIQTVHVDGQGNIFYAGYFSDQVTFNDPASTTLTAQNYTDAFLAKADAEGNVLWVQHYTSASDPRITGISTDPSGNLYLSMSGLSGTDVDPGSGQTLLDAGGLVSLTSSGEFRFGFRAGLASAVDANGDSVYIAGDVYYEDMDPGPDETFVGVPGGWPNGFIAKYDLEGNFRWAREFATELSDEVYDLVVTPAGNPTIIGMFSGELELDTSTGIDQYTPVGPSDQIVVQYDSSGNVRWSSVIADADPSYVTSPQNNWLPASIDSDSLGALYATGRFRGNADFGSDVSLQKSGNSERAYLWKLDSEGNSQWAVDLDGPFGETSSGKGVVVDSLRDTVWVAGDFRSSFAQSVPGRTPLSGEATQGFLLATNPSGNELFAASLGGTSSDRTFDVAVDFDSAAIVAADFNSGFADPGEDIRLTSAGLSDGLLLRYGASSAGLEPIQVTNSVPEVLQLSFSSDPDDPSAVSARVVVNDRGVDDNLTFEIDWGDETTDTNVLLLRPPNGENAVGEVSHRYRASGTYEVNVIAIDDAGEKSDLTAQTVAINAPPVAEIDSLWFTDKDETGTSYVQVHGPAVSEASGPLYLRIELQSASSTQGAIDVAVDIDGETSILTAPFSVGAPYVWLEVPIVNDEFADPDKTITLEVLSGDNVIVGPFNRTTYTIEDDEETQITATISDTEVWEDHGAVTVTVSSSVAASADIPIPISISGTRVSSNDYAVATPTLLLPAGRTSAELTINIVDDNSTEDTEFLTIQLQPTKENTFHGFSSELNISDDDPTLDLRWLKTNKQNISVEEGETARANFRLSSPTNKPVEFEFEYDGRIYSHAIRPGDVEFTLPISRPNDSLFDSEETRRIRILTAQNADVKTAKSIRPTLGCQRYYKLFNRVLRSCVEESPRILAVTVIDNDGLPKSFIGKSAAEDILNVAEGDTYYFDIRLDQAIYDPVDYAPGPFGIVLPVYANVDFELGGTASDDDFLLELRQDSSGSLQSSSVTFGLGTPGRVVRLALTPNLDQIAEGTETIELRLVSGTGVEPVLSDSLTIKIHDSGNVLDWADATDPFNVNDATPGVLHLPDTTEYVSSGTDTTFAPTSIPIDEISVGSLAIPVMQDGYITDSIVFFDQNKDGEHNFVDFGLDGVSDFDAPNEPFGKTLNHGRTALITESSWDNSGDGIIDIDDGLFVGTGGQLQYLDEEFLGRYRALPGFFTLNPISTLIADISLEQGTTAIEAEAIVRQSLDLPSYDLRNGDFLLDIRKGDNRAANAYATVVALENTVYVVSRLVQESGDNRSTQAIWDAFYKSYAQRIVTLSEPYIPHSVSNIRLAVRDTLFRLGASLAEDVVRTSAQLLAGANQSLFDLQDRSPDARIDFVARSQRFTRDTIVPPLVDLHMGVVTSAQVLEEFQNKDMKAEIDGQLIGNVFPASLYVTDALAVEDPSGSALRFKIGLYDPPEERVSVRFHTQGSDAVAGEDYIESSGVLTWHPGESLTKEISVPLIDDALAETSETLRLLLSDPINAFINRGVATGIIESDDALSIELPDITGVANAKIRLFQGELSVSQNDVEVFRGGYFGETPITILGGAADSAIFTFDLVDVDRSIAPDLQIIAADGVQSRGIFADPTIEDSLQRQVMDGSTVRYATDDDGAPIWAMELTNIIFNRSPIAVADTFNFSASSAIEFNLLEDNGAGLDFDPDGNLDLSRTTVVEPPELGTLTALGDGQYRYAASGAFDSLSESESTVIQFVYLIADTYGETNSATVTLNIQGENDTPSLDVADASVVVNETESATQVGTFADVDLADQVTVTASVGTITLDNGNAGAWSWAFDPADGPDGSQTVMITADDRNGGVSRVYFDLTVNNLDPTLAVNTTAVVIDEGSSTSKVISTSDVPADTVSVAASLGTISADGGGNWTWSYDGTDDLSTTVVEIAATDEDGGLSTTEFDLAVQNVDPTLMVDAVTGLGAEDNLASTLDTHSVSGGFTVSGPLDTHTVIIDWGEIADNADNAAEDREQIELASSDPREFSFAHQYRTGGIFTVTVTVIDDDGGVVSDASTRLWVSGVRLDPNTGELQVVGTDRSDVGAAYVWRSNLLVSASFLPKHHWWLPGGTVSFPLDEVETIAVHMGDGDDTFAVSGGIDVPTVVDGGEGDDLLTGGGGASLLLGGAGDDLLYGGGGPSRIEGGSGRDRLFGGRGDDLLFGGDGDDRLYGNDGNDALSGGLGDDKLWGGDGNDLLIGGYGRDKLRGDRGDDLLIANIAGNEDEFSSLDQALAEWDLGRLDAALAALGTLSEDYDRDKLRGQRGDDQLYGSSLDQLKS